MTDATSQWLNTLDEKKIKFVVAFTCLHAVLVFGSIAYAMPAGFAGFDNPDQPEKFGAGIAEASASKLTLPGRLLWTRWASQNLPDGLEWTLFVANSLLWGIVAGALTSAVSNHRHKT